MKTSSRSLTDMLGRHLRHPEGHVWTWGLRAAVAVSTLAFAPEWVVAVFAELSPQARILAVVTTGAALVLLVAVSLSFGALPPSGPTPSRDPTPSQGAPATSSTRSPLDGWAAKIARGAKLVELPLFLAVLGSVLGWFGAGWLGLDGGAPWLASGLILLAAALHIPGRRGPRVLLSSPAPLAIGAYGAILVTGILNIVQGRFVPIAPAPAVGRTAWQDVSLQVPLHSFAFGAAVLAAAALLSHPTRGGGRAILGAVHGFLFFVTVVLLVGYGVEVGGSRPALFAAMPDVFGPGTPASAAAQGAFLWLLGVGMYATFFRLDRLIGSRTVGSLGGLAAGASVAVLLLRADVGTLAALWVLALLASLLPAHVALLVRGVARTFGRRTSGDASGDASGWRVVAHGLAGAGTAVALIGALLFLAGCTRPVPEPRLDEIRLPEGFRIDVYVDGIDEARQMALGDDGTLYVSTKTLGRVYAVPDRDGDARGDEVIVLASDLQNSHGLVFHEGDLYVAEETRILRYPSISDRLHDPPAPEVLTDEIPPRDYHEQVFMALGPEGRLHVSTGSPCDVCPSEHPLFATIARLEPSGRLEVVAEGVRNSMGFDWHPETGELWFTDNGRDWMGDEVPPDELNRAPRDELDFGFPHCHGSVPDPDFGQGVDCSRFTPPVLELPAHVAVLGMTFYDGDGFPAAYRNRVLMAEHGSYNRSERVGYRVSMAELREGAPPEYQVFADGWLTDDGEVWGRPVDVLVMPDGSLLVSDDFGDAVYRISYRPSRPSSSPPAGASSARPVLPPGSGSPPPRPPSAARAGAPGPGSGP